MLSLNPSLKRYFKGKKVLVTGGLGFLGSNLTQYLTRLQAKVTILDCMLKIHGGSPFNIQNIKSQVKWVKGDIRNLNLVKKLIKNQHVLFNIAAQTSHTDSMQNPYLDIDINTRGQMNLLEACKSVNPKIRIVYCSTRAIYGSQKRKINEETLPNPLDIYSVDKLAGEYYHKIYSQVHGLNATILRVSNGYGPRAQMKQPSFGILNWFIRLIIDNQNIKIFGTGKQVRDYLYVDDIIHSFLLTAAHPKLKGEILNVAAGYGMPLIDIVKRIIKVSGKGKIVHVPWPSTNKKIDVGDFVADVSKIRKKLKWSPQISLDQGIKETLRYYEKNKRHYWS